MASSYARLAGLGCVLLVLSLGAGCGKSEASCQSSAQCADGYICGDEGTCEAIDGSPDAPPPCPTASHYCAAPAPDGWSGPVVGSQAATGETLASCTGEYATETAVVGEGIVASGDCSCSCPGTAGTVTCGDATIREQDLCAICGAVETCISQSVPGDGVCRLVSGTLGDGNNLRYFLGTVQAAGTCPAPEDETNTLASNFASEERYCAADGLAASCPDSGVCLPSAVDAAFDALCIFQAGDQSCPAGYPAKELRFANIDDARTCSACTCSAPEVGTNCGGLLEIGSGDCASNTDVTANSCSANPVNANGTTGVRYTPSPDNSCTQGGAEVTGEALGAGQVTYCCIEAIADPS